MLRKLLLITLLAFPTWLYAAERVNINTANAEVLAEAIKGIGEKKAQAIVAYRRHHGSFKTIDDLALVKGVGEKTVTWNRDVLTVGSKQTR